MTARVAELWRYPIKSVSAERLNDVAVTSDRPVPGDRQYAIAHEAHRLQPGDDWAKKLNFVRGVAAPSLMAVTSRTEGERTILSHPQRPDLSVALETPEGQHSLIEWVRPLWPEGRPAAAKVISLAKPLTDNPEPWISILSLESLRDLSAHMQMDLDTRRFRGNIWVEGLPAWDEFGLIGRVIRIGEATLRVDARITRCRATCADPATGLENGETLDALETNYGHKDFGISATVVGGGTIRIGDEVVS